jgi:hypothetical protein
VASRAVDLEGFPTGFDSRRLICSFGHLNAARLPKQVHLEGRQDRQGQDKSSDEVGREVLSGAHGVV